MTENFQAELEAQQREVRALGRELLEASANLNSARDLHWAGLHGVTLEGVVFSQPPGSTALWAPRLWE